MSFAQLHVYFSTDSGKNFKVIEDKILDGKIRKDFGIMKSPVNGDKVSFSWGR